MADPIRLERLDDVLWIDRDWDGTQPERTNDLRKDAFTEPGFIIPAYFRISQDIKVDDGGNANGTTLTLFSSEGPVIVHSFVSQSGSDDHRNDRYRAQDGSTIQVQRGLSGDTVVLNNGTLVLAQVNPPEEIDPDSVKAGNPFTLPAKAKFGEWAFQGFDIKEINPANLQSGGIRAAVYQTPSDGGLGFHVNKTQGGAGDQLVANGMLFLPDRTSNTGQTTDELSSAQEYENKLAVGVGVGVESKEFGGFSLNEDFKFSKKQAFESSESTILATGCLCSHVFVQHPGILRLHPEFMRRALELAEQVTAGEQPRYDSFIRHFGTHYARSVTCGARYTEAITFSKTATQEASTFGIDLKAAAQEGSKEFAQAQQSLNFSFEHGESIKKEIQHQVASFQTVGGDPSKGGLALGNDPVPIFADLRPLTDLLNPVHFPDDPVVYTRVRAGLDAALRIGTKEEAPPPSTGAQVEVSQLQIKLDGSLGTYSFTLSLRNGNSRQVLRQGKIASSQTIVIGGLQRVTLPPDSGDSPVALSIDMARGFSTQVASISLDASDFDGNRKTLDLSTGSGDPNFQDIEQTVSVRLRR